jgi:Putative beta-barrel porin 2
MKNFFVSAGIVAISAASLHAEEYAPDFTAMDATKPWTVSGTLRGFYDDNYTTTPNGHKQGSAGFEFSPSASLIIPLQQTELGLRYTYGLYYYQQRENQGANPIDQTHQVDLWVDHAFTEAWEGKVMDSFISQQDPSLTTSGTALPYRAEGNNIQNIGTISSHNEFSQLFSTDVGYQNTWDDYHQQGATFNPINGGSFGPGGSGATYAGLLNQVDHSIFVNLNYQYLPDLAFLVGYNFSFNDYTGNEPIAVNIPAPGVFDVYYSNYRNSMSHNIYVGGQYAMTASLSILANAGFQYVDNYNLPSFDHQDSGSYQPTANIAITYTYLPGDYVQVGFTQAQNSSATSDVSGSGSLTLYQETSVLYATVNHQITPKLTGSLIGHYQYSTYVGGANDGEPQNWYTFGLNLAYALNPFVSVDAGYNFYYLTKTGPLPGYSRNVGYASVTATF